MNEYSAIYRVTICFLVAIMIAVIFITVVIGWQFIAVYGNSIARALYTFFILSLLMAGGWLYFFLALDIDRRSIRNQILKQDLRLVEINPEQAEEPQTEQERILAIGQKLIEEMGGSWSWNYFAREAFGSSGGGQVKKLKTIMSEAGYNVDATPPSLFEIHDSRVYTRYTPLHR